ncbi:MAG: DsbA family oxidoreductase [Bacillus subtilis]|nr:DsbA family oxidoreductase [Bacillus subtilis]
MAKKRFDQALELFPHSETVDVTLMSFELDPDFPQQSSLDAYDAIAAKSNMTRAQAIAECELVTKQAFEVGLDYHYERLISVNTFAAHRLNQYAKTQGKSVALGALLMKAHFTDGLDLNDYATLAIIAEQAGLNKAESLIVLASNEYSDEVRADELAGDDIGIEVPPFFVFDDKYAVAGGHPKETYLKVLNKVFNERLSK